MKLEPLNETHPIKNNENPNINSSIQTAESNAKNTGAPPKRTFVPNLMVDRSKKDT